MQMEHVILRSMMVHATNPVGPVIKLDLWIVWNVLIQTGGGYGVQPQVISPNNVLEDVQIIISITPVKKHAPYVTTHVKPAKMQMKKAVKLANKAESS